MVRARQRFVALTWLFGLVLVLGLPAVWLLQVGSAFLGIHMMAQVGTGATAAHNVVLTATNFLDGAFTVLAASTAALFASIRLNRPALQNHSGANQTPTGDGVGGD